MPRPMYFAGLLGLAIAVGGCSQARLARTSHESAPGAEHLAALGLEQTESGEIQQVGWFDRRSKREKDFDKACQPQCYEEYEPRDIDELLSPCMAEQLLKQGRRHRHPEGDKRNQRVDNRINKDGCHPERERLPMLKRVGDPENAKSDNKAIKKAAEIKMAEDQADQKIKALKYLGMIGCCVYDKDGGITAAFLAALDDPTPRVRMTAVQVISGEYCGETYQHCCTCKKPIVEKLADMAWGIDDEGCYKEPIQEIRDAAKAIVCKCCPNEQPGFVAAPEQIVEPVDPGVTPETIPETAPPAVPVEPATEPQAERPEAIDSEQVSAQQPGSLEGYSVAAVSEVEDEPAHVAAVADVKVDAPGLAAVADQPAPAPIGGAVKGTIEAVNLQSSTVMIRLTTADVLPLGTRVAMFHKYSLGRLASMIEFEVISAGEGVCTVRPVGNPDVSRAPIGATVTAVVK